MSDKRIVSIQLTKTKSVVAVEIEKNEYVDADGVTYKNIDTDFISDADNVSEEEKHTFKIYLCGVNTLVLIYCARLVRRKRALIKQIKKSPQKYTEILLKADTQLPDEEMERFLHEAEESRKNAELEKKEIKNKKSTCIIVRDAIFEICNKIFLFTGIYLLACKIFNRDLTNIEIILAKCSYAEFAFLVLLYPMCIEKKSKEKGTYTTNLTVGTIALFLELGLILFSLH